MAGSPLAPPTAHDAPAPPALHDAAQGRLAYPVWLGRGALGQIAQLVQGAAPAYRYVVVTDEAVVAAGHAGRVVAALRDAGADPLVVAIPAGEAHKTRESWALVTDRMLAGGCGRDTTVLALGGGVVGDLAGFVAATYMRGVPVVQLPTTLLAMVDASVGGKVAVDAPAGKNLVGAFHPPAAVIVDPDVLATLPAGELRTGAAEAVKHGVIASAEYFAEVEALLPQLERAARGEAPHAAALATVVGASIGIKAAVVAEDPLERGRRRTLNFGHTLGHAVEALSGYTVRHGEAVAIGMVLEAEAAERAGIAAGGTRAAIAGALRAGRLPTALPAGMSVDAVLAATRSDKKARGGAVEYALPARLGAMAPCDGRWSVALPDALVLETLRASAAGGAP